MNNIIKTSITLLACTLLSGCALFGPQSRPLHVTYKTDLAGATLLQNGAYVGTTPITLTRYISEEQYQQGVVTIEPVTIQWASGVAIEVPAETIYLSNGMKYEFTYIRPKNAPNVQIDISMAQLEESKQARIAADNRAAVLEQRLAQMEDERRRDRWQQQDLLRKLEQATRKH